MNAKQCELKKLSAELLRRGLNSLQGRSKTVKERRKLINGLLKGGTVILSLQNGCNKMKTRIIRGDEANKVFILIHETLCGDAEMEFPDDNYKDAEETARFISG